MNNYCFILIFIDVIGFDLMGYRRDTLQSLITFDIRSLIHDPLLSIEIIIVKKASATYQSLQNGTSVLNLNCVRHYRLK